MEWIDIVFGVGKDLKTSQIIFRAILVFLVSWALIRISGRRSFGLKTPLDNIIVILLGALLSRGIVGASPMGGVIAGSAMLVILHRIAGWATTKNKQVQTLVEGEKILLYKAGIFQKENFKKAMVNEENIMQGLRKSALTNKLNEVELIYMEPNGEITIVKKKSEEQ